MQNFIKTIINAIQTWTKGKIKNSIADWDQNDKNTDNYIKNRTHYAEITEEVLIPRRTVSFSNGGWGIVFLYPDDLVDVIIVFDDKEYEWSDVLNNTHFESELFYVDLGRDQMGPPFLSFGVHDKETTVHTIGVTRKVEIVHKLDKKYLDIDGKMDAINPIGEGSFSMNRKPDTAIGGHSHAEGYNAEASGPESHAEGCATVASGAYSHAEGIGTTASSHSSHAEGYNVIASGFTSHAEGSETKASGDYSHAEGGSNTASGDYSHAEGYNTIASGDYSHAEGAGTTASSSYSHAEGLNTVASKFGCHAEGIGTTASGLFSHAEGNMTIASGSYSHAEGKFNISDTTKTYAHIVGNGASDTKRSNAHTLDWDGNAWYQGDVYVGSTSGTNKDEGSKKLATEEYVDTALENIQLPDVQGELITVEDIDKICGASIVAASEVTF